MFKILKRQLNYNMNFDHNIPLSIDFLTDNQLSMKDYKQWIPETLFKDEFMKKLNLVNGNSFKRYEGRKRMYIFIIATNHFNIDTFQLPNIFTEEY